MTFWAPERPGLIEMAFLEAVPTLHLTLAQFPLPLKCWSALTAEQGKIYYFYESGDVDVCEGELAFLLCLFQPAPT